ncbi:MAG: TIGR03086 family protein [Chloroflexi bacterium]|nr:TIGR03086 family protein [Chloroflexota bacterium]
MTNGQLYARAMRSTLRIIEQVPADRWHAPTPCTAWDAQQVANHIIGENLWAGELFAGKTVAQVGASLDGDLTGADPAAAYRRSVEIAQRAIDAPGAMEATCHLSFGDHSGADYASQLFMDTLIHGWDIAKGTGQDAHMDAELVSRCLPIAEILTRQFRPAGVFGDDLPVSEDADQQRKLLALVGRRP